jgi:hypothetical protein
VQYDHDREGRQVLTPEEMFLFDLQGYLLLKNVLTASEVAELNAIADREFPCPSDAQGERTAPSVLLWGEPYVALLDHPEVVPYLRGVLGARFRLDHDYGIFMRPGDSRGSLHGGEGNMDDWWYACRDGIIRNGLCTLIYFLTPAQTGEGGFTCIPGSHKSRFLAAIPEEVRNYRRAAPYVAQPAVEAGDVVLFTEALVHGTMPWIGSHERRIVLFKYGPGHCAASNKFYDLEAMPTLTARQRLLLAPPSLYNRPEVSL